MKRYLARSARNLTTPVGLSWIPLVLLIGWAGQMAEWHWLDSALDWRGWVGFLCGWAGAWILEAVIQEIRGRVIQRSERRKAATS